MTPAISTTQLKTFHGDEVVGKTCTEGSTGTTRSTGTTGSAGSTGTTGSTGTGGQQVQRDQVV